MVGSCQQIVSTHARTRRATLNQIRLRRPAMFQLTLARGERHAAVHVACQWSVSTHARTRRATFQDLADRTAYLFQLTLARGERQRGHRRTGCLYEVSTHARTRRATRSVLVSFSFFLFQLTLARGERRSNSWNKDTHRSFNSRSHAASDARCSW